MAQVSIVNKQIARHTYCAEVARPHRLDPLGRVLLVLVWTAVVAACVGYLGLVLLVGYWIGLALAELVKVAGW